MERLIRVQIPFPGPVYGALGKRPKPPDPQSGDHRFKSGTRRQHLKEPRASRSGRLIVNQESAGSSPAGSAIRLRSLAAPKRWTLNPSGVSSTLTGGTNFNGVWCSGISIRVLGTRGVSSILTTPTIFVGVAQQVARFVASEEVASSNLATHSNPFAPVAQRNQSGTLRTYGL